MALRDLDENKNYIYPVHTNIKYDWTFMTSWIGTGLCFILAFIYICLLCVDYDDINETGKYSTFSEWGQCEFDVDYQMKLILVFKEWYVRIYESKFDFYIVWKEIYESHG